MVKQLTRTGNSFALVIDKPILELVNFDPNMPIEISTDDGKRLILSPVKDAARRKKFRAALDWTTKKHAKTLKRLAE
jgi:antitoxin component of MazEF toxin-antitoxin module